MDIAPSGHALTHVPHFRHFDSEYSLVCENDIPSGLWHQMQDRGQPLKKKVILIPGPSFMEYRFISKTGYFSMM